MALAHNIVFRICKNLFYIVFFYCNKVYFSIFMDMCLLLYMYVTYLFIFVYLTSLILVDTMEELLLALFSFFKL